MDVGEEQEQDAAALKALIINTQPDEVKPLVDYINNDLLTGAAAGAQIRLYPMVLDRLVKINHQAESPDDYEQQRAQRLLLRDFNLSARTLNSLTNLSD